jgi:hypothetical protein
MIEKIEQAARLTRDRMLQETPQNPDVLRMLDILIEELIDASGRPKDPGHG